MNNFIFYSPTEFVFGRDTEAQTGALVQKYGARKVMIVYGGGSVIRSGLLARVEKSLQEVGIPYCMLGGVQPNPIDTKVYCPCCGSTDVSVISGASKAVSVALWGVFAANKVMSKYKCNHCGHKF